MTPERHQRIGQLYLQVLEWPPEQRASLLASACPDDPALRRDVESLLRHDVDQATIVDAHALDVLGRTLAEGQSQSWAGRQVGHYQIAETLGRGGMGHVYRARDLRLDRDVAIKALPLLYSADAVRLHRFEQEARTAGQLNHPNVLTVHDIGVHEGAPYIVTELLEGVELREKLVRGPLPLRIALDYAVQVVRGLAATHARGIVHRDLKPENLFVTPDRRVKILDFGLAKLTAPWPASGAAPSEAGRALTVPGLIVGTIGYLSPEQLRGDQADHRADIFAFGVILYEMLTGRRPFERESAVDTVAAILREEPLAVGGLNPATPAMLERIVHRCLEKDPGARFQSAADLEIALEALSSSAAASALVSNADRGPSTAASGRRLSRVGRTAAWMVVSLVSAAIGAIAWQVRSTVPRLVEPVARFDLPFEVAALVPSNLEVSPDGRYIAYVTSRLGVATLFLHHLANVDPTPIATIEDGRDPFFSADSQWLGFFADGKMKKVPVRGGAAIALAEAPSGRHASWDANGTIVFAPVGRSGLFQVSDQGGAPANLTTPDPARSETSHAEPHWLPGGRAFVYVARGETMSDIMVMAYSLEDGTTRTLVKGDSSPRYLPSGHLVYLQDETLMAAPFDPSRLALLGTSVPVVERVTAYSVSAQGLLIHAPPAPDATSANSTRLVWVNREGAAEPVRNAPARGYSSPRISPTGRHIVLAIQEAGEAHIWTFDLTRDVLTRLTFEGRNLWPVWSHDGRHVIYASNRAPTSWDLFRKSADGTANEELLLAKPDLQIPHSSSKDDAALSVSEFTATGTSAWMFSMRDKTLRPLVSNARSPSLSPDGRWVAYTSNESGRDEVYVRPTSGAPGRWQISTDGGLEPVWARSGAEIFYRERDKMLVVSVETGAALRHTAPRTLFTGQYNLDPLKDKPLFDVTPDGQRFLMLKAENRPVASRLHAVLNWHSELEQVMSESR